jgi:protein involved in sex pheromone biosynthesis
LFIQTGPVELAAVGVSIALFNQASRIAIFPLVSITTSFVAEEDTLNGARSQVEENGCLEATTPLNAKTETKEFFTAEKYTVLLFS